MGVVDVDNPANLPKEAVRKVVRFVVNTLNKAGHPNIVMFTGNSFQVWFGASDKQELGNIRDVRELVKSMLYNPEILTFKRTDAIDSNLVHIDDKVLFLVNLLGCSLIYTTLREQSLIRILQDCDNSYHRGRY